MDQRCEDQSSAIFYHLPILQRHNNPRGIISPLSKCQFSAVEIDKSGNEGAAWTVLCQSIQAESKIMCCAYMIPLANMPISSSLRRKTICRCHTIGIGRSKISTLVTRFKAVSVRKKARTSMQCPGISKFQKLSTGVH